MSGAWTGTVGHDGIPDDPGAGWYVIGVALAGLAATGLMHLLIAFTLQPIRIFGWVMALATMTAILASFATIADLAWSMVTAVLNLVVGLAVGAFVTGTARTAMNAASAVPPDP